MKNVDYQYASLQIVKISPAARKLAIRWIWLGIYALVAAGFLAVLLALSRTPVVGELMPDGNFFKIVLVAHVNLSVLVWFLACAGLLWSVFGVHHDSLWVRLAFYLALAGTLMISISPFLGDSQPLMNNYVPVILHPCFFIGLTLLMTSLLIKASFYIVHFSPKTDCLSFGMYLAAISVLLIILCIVLSYLLIPEEITGEFFYDLLFWGGGHVHQFTNTVLLLVAWLMLAKACGKNLYTRERTQKLLLLITILPLVFIPWLYLYPIDSSEHILGFTELMRKGGLASIPLGLLVFISIFQFSKLKDEQKPLRASLICSITLFAAGGILGFMIQGSNTVIPAHYHGCIVGVTLAFMGVVFLLLPLLGYPIQHIRMAYWMPWCYGGGQLMHITALAWSGGYGVKRKALGQTQGLESLQEVAGMLCMGIGGLTAVIGGLMFLYIVISTLTKSSGNRLVSLKVRA